MSIKFLSVVATAGLLTLVGCSSGSEDDGASTDVEAPESDSTTTTQAPDPIRILLVNDDGIGAPGIDGISTDLGADDRFDLWVVAPAENQSGTSGTVSEQQHGAEPAETAGGIAGTAVAGTPADSVL